MLDVRTVPAVHQLHGLVVDRVQAELLSLGCAASVLGAASNSTARSSVMSYTLSLLGMDLKAPSCFTYGPNRPTLASIGLPVSG